MIDTGSDHFKAFKLSLAQKALEPNKAGGKTWATFSAGLTGLNPTIFNPASAAGIARHEVVDLVRSEASTRDCVAAALAWGGMSMRKRRGQELKDHQHFFSDAGQNWLDCAESIRAGQLPRAEAYETFRRLRAQGKMKYVGVAFFTKLIYFLGAGHEEDFEYQGYIVDQWSGCSMNLLTGRRLIHCNVTMTADKMNDARYGFIVSDVNTAEDYEKYSKCVEELAMICELDVHQVDHALQRPGTWRDHVITARIP